MISKQAGNVSVVIGDRCIACILDLLAGIQEFVPSLRNFRQTCFLKDVHVVEISEYVGLIRDGLQSASAYLTACRHQTCIGSRLVVVGLRQLFQVQKTAAPGRIHLPFCIISPFFVYFLNFLSVFSFLQVIITYISPLKDVILSEKISVLLFLSAFLTMKETMFSCFLFSFLHFCIIMVSNRIKNLHNQPISRKERTEHELQKHTSAGYPDHP